MEGERLFQLCSGGKAEEGCGVVSMLRVGDEGVDRFALSPLLVSHPSGVQRNAMLISPLD